MGGGGGGGGGGGRITRITAVRRRHLIQFVQVSEREISSARVTGFSAGADIHIDLIGTRRTIADITSRDGAWLLGICGCGARWGYAEVGRDGDIRRWGEMG